MRIICSICRDAFTTSDAGRINGLMCGHIFHEACLKEWIKSHLTCPQCRASATVGMKIFLEFQVVTDDVGTLKDKIETTQFQLKMAEIDNVKFKNELRDQQKKISELQEELAKLQNVAKELEQCRKNIHQYKQFCSKKANEVEFLKSNVHKLEAKVQELTEMQQLLGCSDSEADEIFKSCTLSLQSLQQVIVNLKRNLGITSRKNMEVLKNCRHWHLECLKSETKLKEMEKEVSILKKCLGGKDYSTSAQVPGRRPEHFTTDPNLPSTSRGFEPTIIDLTEEPSSSSGSSQVDPFSCTNGQKSPVSPEQKLKKTAYQKTKGNDDGFNKRSTNNSPNHFNSPRIKRVKIVRSRPKK